MVGIDIAAAGAKGVWQRASRYSVWSKEYPAQAPALSIVEALPGGLLRVPDDPRLFHVIPAGTRHRLEHLFGFWRISGSDTVIVRAQVDRAVSYTFIVRNDWPEYAADETLFACANCDLELQRFTFETPRFGVQAYWTEALRLARAFNAQYSGRACTACGNSQPLAYGIDEEADTAEERAARMQW